MSDIYSPPNVMASARDSKIFYPNYIGLTSEGNEHKNSTVGKPFTLLDASREEGSKFLQDWEIESEDSVNLPPNAQDYNNMTLDECEIVSGVTLVEPRDAFKDPF